jgi:hypothetical protein
VACLCNHCCWGKAVCITYFECEFVPLLISTWSACTVLHHSWPLQLVSVSSTLSHKWHNFRKIVTEYKMCALIFSTTLSETFLILRIIQQLIIINIQGLHVKYLILLSSFIETWIFSTDFRKIFIYQISWKSIQ